MSRYSNRWDSDRLARERDYRNSGHYDDYYPPPAVESPRRVSRAAPVAYDERQYYEQDRYGPRGSFAERRYFEEDEYYDPRTRHAQMVPYRPARPEAPPRPGIIRRQSSLDTFDRPPRRVQEYDRPRPRQDFYVPEPPNPRQNRYARREPTYSREYYDDVAIQDPDYYGDDGFREYREREWVSSKRRDSPSPARSRAATETTSREEVVEEKETVVEKKESKGEKPFPRRGKTKMPKRLVHTKVLYDLGYTFYDENEKTIVINMALGPDNIDEIFVKSKEYREKDVSTTRLIEAPPAQTETVTKTTTTIEVPAAPTVREPSPAPESVREERIAEEISTKPLSEAPRSVREWDGLTADTRSVHSRRHRSHSRRRRRSPSPEVVKQLIIERSPTRARSRRRSRRRPSYDEEIIEERIVRQDIDLDESNSIHVGPLALVRDHPRSEREIDEEIEILRAERRRRDRRVSRDDEYVEFIRAESRSPSPAREVYVERRGDNMVLKREKPRSRSKSVPRPPSARAVRNMMYTLT